MSRLVLFVALAAIPFVVACNVRANADCASLTSNSASGVTKCGTESCTAMTYCSNPSGNVCANGCTSGDNCGQGERCDLSRAQTDLGGNKVGQCITAQLTDQNSGCNGDGGANDGGDAGDAQPEDAGRD